MDSAASTNCTSFFGYEKPESTVRIFTVVSFIVYLVLVIPLLHHSHYMIFAIVVGVICWTLCIYGVSKKRVAAIVPYAVLMALTEVVLATLTITAVLLTASYPEDCHPRNDESDALEMITISAAYEARNKLCLILRASTRGKNLLLVITSFSMIVFFAVCLRIFSEFNHFVAQLETYHIVIDDVEKRSSGEAIPHKDRQICSCLSPRSHYADAVQYRMQPVAFPRKANRGYETASQQKMSTTSDVSLDFIISKI